MNDLKYVIILPSCFSLEPNKARAVIFNGLIDHKSIGEAAAKSCNGKILSAGFMSVEKSSELVTCFGESTSLGIQSNPEFDQEICWRTLNRWHPYI